VVQVKLGGLQRRGELFHLRLVGGHQRIRHIQLCLRDLHAVFHRVLLRK
jgi:hypothetical protein